jgi:hypothetical protein
MTDYRALYQRSSEDPEDSSVLARLREEEE